MAAAEQKKSIVFVFEKRDGNGKYDCIEFYAFDERLTTIKEESKVIKIKKRNKEGYKYKYRLVEDLNEIVKPFTLIDHCHTLIDHCHRLAGYASWGHRIFKVGGDYLFCNKRTSTSNCPEPRAYTREAHYFDVRGGVNSAWTKLPMMIASRRDPHLHVIGDDEKNTITLYVCGGYGGQYKEYEKVNHYFSFMEQLQLQFQYDQYDQCQLVTVKGWSRVEIPMPLEVVDIRFLLSANIKESITLAGGRRVGPGLLFGFIRSRSFYLFNPSNNTWESLPHIRFDWQLFWAFTCTNSPTAPAVVCGKRVFWLDYRHNKLVGLDIVSGQYVSILLRKEGLLSFSEYRYELLQPKIVALEEDDDNNEVVMGLVWTDYHRYAHHRKDAEEETELSHISGWHCTKFRVDFDQALHGGPCIKILSRQMCLGPSNKSGIIRAFTTTNFCIDGEQEEDKRRRKKLRSR